MNWKKRLLYWFCEDFVSIDHLNVVMKEQYKARNSIVAHFDQKLINMSITLLEANQKARIALQRIEDLKAEFEELDKISVGMQMERDTHRDQIKDLEGRYEHFLIEQRRIDESVTARIRKIELILEHERLTYGSTH